MSNCEVVLGHFVFGTLACGKEAFEMIEDEMGEERPVCEEHSNMDKERRAEQRARSMAAHPAGKSRSN